jgi:hypothetical protein
LIIKVVMKDIVKKGWNKKKEFKNFSTEMYMKDSFIKINLMEKENIHGITLLII